MTESILALSEALETLKIDKRISNEEAEILLDRAVRGEVDLSFFPQSPSTSLSNLHSTILQLINSPHQSSLPNIGSTASSSKFLDEDEQLRYNLVSEMKSIAKSVRSSINSSLRSLVQASLVVHSEKAKQQPIILHYTNEILHHLFGLTHFELIKVQSDNFTASTMFSSMRIASTQGVLTTFINIWLPTLLPELSDNQFQLTRLNCFSSQGISSVDDIKQLQDAFQADKLVYIVYQPSEPTLQQVLLSNLFGIETNALVLKKSIAPNSMILIAFPVPSNTTPSHVFANNLNRKPHVILKYFEDIFIDQVTTLISSIVFPPPSAFAKQKSPLTLIKKLISLFASQSFILLTEELNELASKTFLIPTQTVYKEITKKSTNQTKWEIRIPSIDSPTLTSSLFQQEAKNLVKWHQSKTKQVSYGSAGSPFSFKHTDYAILDFNYQGILTFVSHPLTESTIRHYNLTIKQQIDNDNQNNAVSSSTNLSYETIFGSCPSILQLIEDFVKDESETIDYLKHSGETDIEITSSGTLTSKNGKRSFSVIIGQFNSLNLLPPNLRTESSERKGNSKIAKIKNALNKLAFITRTTKGAVSKEMVLNSIDIKNSFVREYLPDRDLKKIVADEQKRSEHALIRTTQSVLYNPDESKRSLVSISGSINQADQIPAPIPADFYLDKAKDAAIDSFNLDLFDLDEKEKIRMVWSVFNKCGFIQKYQIPDEQFCAFLHTIRAKYNKRKNPFHNFNHGISVMHGCYMIAFNTSASTVLSPVNQFALVLSGICHDISHTAHTNVFEANSLTKLAIRYHDKSILEQHHIAVTFKVMRRKETNILMNLPLDQVQEIRKMVISNILSTDIKQHFDLLSEFELKLLPKALPGKNNSTLAAVQPEAYASDQNLITSMIIHASDFHGTAQEFNISKQWSLLVNQEFSKQYKEEGEMNIPQTPYLKDLDKIEILAKNEIGFVNAIVRPLWQILSKFLGEDLSASTNKLTNNIKQWEETAKNQQDSAKKKRSSIDEFI